MESEAKIVSKDTRKWITVVSVLYCFGLAGVTTFWGQAGNTLHESAQSWAFVTAIFVISGSVFGQVLDNFISNRSR